MVMKHVVNKAKFFSTARDYHSWIDMFTGIKFCQSEHSPVSKWRRTVTGKTKERFMRVYTLPLSEDGTFPTMVKQDL